MPIPNFTIDCDTTCLVVLCELVDFAISTCTAPKFTSDYIVVIFINSKKGGAQ